MSGYVGYPEYRDSGVEWLGSIPSDWEAVKIGHLTTVRRGASPRPIDDPIYFDERGEYCWTRIADVSASKMYLENSTQRLSDIGSSLSVKLEPGSLFLSIAGTVGKPCITAIKACIHDGFVYFPELKIPPKFLFYVFAGEQAYKGLGKFGTQLNLNTETVGGIRIGVSSPIDMQRIVDFLDHETAKIDTLIEKQQQLIKLLKEKRQAVISHAVTKGLNPDAPMKDSGVEWLGEVPAGWVVCALKHVSNVIDCKHITAEFVDDGIPLASIGEVKSKYVDLTSSKKTTRQYYLELISGGRKPTQGDLIFSRNATVGEVAIVEQIANEFAMGQDVCLIRPFIKVLPAFLYFFLTSTTTTRQLELLMIGSTFKRINVDDIRNFDISIPCANDQSEIVEHITLHSKMLDRQLEKAGFMIGLLKERRTALISAAVTGKIDVRNWQPPKSSPTPTINA